ncbi:MAG: hypothetical protein AAF211_17745, partial [Myxococcota bacterium]
MRTTMAVALMGSALACTEHERVDWEGVGFHATIDPTGLTFAPEEGPAWSWQLDSVEVDEASWDAVTIETDAVTGSPGLHDIDHGGLLERYVTHDDHVSQHFYLLEDPGGALTVRGRVATDGALASTAGGWTWTRPDGSGVFMGDVTVFDADGIELPAHMDVDGAGTTIHIAAEVLDQAAYPVWIDPEIGPDDFVISTPDPAALAGRMELATRRASAGGGHLVVWSDFITGDREIFGRLVSGIGQPVGGDVRLTLQGVADDGLGSDFPSVAWNATLDEFFVVYEAEVAGDVEIFGQRVSATDASTIAAPVRLSVTLAEGDGQEARRPDVVFDAATGGYLVVWAADVTSQGELEILLQRVDGLGGLVGSPVQLSEQGPAGDRLHFTDQPSIAYNATDGEALVVWMGSSPNLPLKLEIFGQRVAADGTELGDDVRINVQGQADAEDEDAFEPDVAWAPSANRYLVTWSGDSSLDGLVEGEFEIYGQIVDADGTEPSPEFRISTVRGIGDRAFSASSPDVAFDPAQNAFVVVWDGEGARPTQVNDEFEIYLQTVSTSGALEGPVEVITDIGTDGDGSRIATDPEIDFQGGVALVAYTTNDPAVTIGASRGIGGQLWTSEPLDLDGDGFTILTGDCDDLDPTVYPGAP